MEAITGYGISLRIQKSITEIIGSQEVMEETLQTNKYNIYMYINK